MMKLNPNHPVAQELDGEWHKLLAVVMHKFGHTEVVLDLADFENFIATYPDNSAALVADTRGGETISLRMVTRAEGERLARQEGGLVQ